MQHKSATLLAKSKEIRDDSAIVEVVVWSIQEPLPPCTHRFKYRLFYGTAAEQRVRYDNERGKGDHRHVAGIEYGYEFSTIDKLLDDFERDVRDWSAP